MGSDFFELKPIEDMVNIYDALRKPVKKGDRKDGIYPYYGASGITDYVDNFIFDGNYVLLSEDGDNLTTRNTPIAFMARGKFWVNNHAHILKGKDGNDTDFICYALQVADINSYISGSTRPKITQRDMKNIPIHCPPLPEQKAIAHILGSLDDKIELNRQMNETLEAMAQALFKSWFVDFDPVLDNALAAGNTIPDELSARAEQRQAMPPSDTNNHAIRALFPDAFEFTEKMGWIPEGWKNGTLADICFYGKGKVNTSELNLENYVSTENMNKEKSGISYAASIASTDTVPKFSIGQTLVSNIRPYFKKIWFASFSGGRSNDVLGFQANNSAANEYLFNLLYQDSFFDYMTATSTGTKMPRGDKTAIMSWSIAIPSPILMEEFSNKVNPLYLSNQLRSTQTISLAKLRDTLLPKLLSGELRITDAAAMVEEA